MAISNLLVRIGVEGVEQTVRSLNEADAAVLDFARNANKALGTQVPAAAAASTRAADQLAAAQLRAEVAAASLTDRVQIYARALDAANPNTVTYYNLQAKLATAQNAVERAAQKEATALAAEATAADKASISTGKLGEVAIGAARHVGTLLVDATIRGTQALVDLGAKGLRAAGDLQQSVANISTIKPEIDTSAVFSSLNLMQTRIPQTAAQIGDSLYNVFSSIDVTQQQALRLTEEFSRSAVGAQTSAETFGTAALGVMNAYGLAVEDAAHVSDVFFNTVNLGVVTGEQLASSLGPVTQSAKAAGVELDVLGGLIAGVTKEGGPAAQNINNLNNLLQKVTTKEAQAQINALGVATVDATGNFRPIIDILGDVKVELGGMTEAARTNALQKIFPDAQARIGAQTILSQLDFVKQAIDTNITSSGSAAAAYEKMSATFNSQAQLGKNALVSLATTLGSAATPAVTAFLRDAVIPSINQTNLFVQSMLATDDPLQTLITRVDAIVPGLQGTIAVIGTTAGFLDDNLVPAVYAAAAATTAYGLTSLPALSAGLTTAIPLLYAKGAALTASLGPLALVAAATFVAVKAYGSWTDSLQANVDKQLASSEVMQQVIQLQDRIASSAGLQTPAVATLNDQLDAQKVKYDELALTLAKQEELAGRGIRSQYATKGAIDETRAALAVQEQAIDATAQRLEQLVMWQDAVTYSQEHGVSAGSAYVDYINSSTVALGAATVGVAGLGTATALTEEELTKLSESLLRATEDGAAALGQVAASESTFRDEREALTAAHEERLRALVAEKAQAKTAAAATEVDARIAKENEGYATEITNLTSSYQAQQAAQRQHLGLMLIEHVNAWALMGEVSSERAVEMTAALGREYGIQADNASLTFGRMVGSMLDWRDNASISTASVISELESAEDSAVDTKGSMDALTGQYTAELIQNFLDGKIDADQLTDAVNLIPTRVQVQIDTNAAAAAAAVDSASNALDRLKSRAVQNVQINARVDAMLLRQSPSPIEQVMSAIEEFAKRPHTFKIGTAGLDKMKDILSIVNDLGGAGASLGKLGSFTAPRSVNIDAFATSIESVIGRLATVAGHFKVKALSHAADFAESASKLTGLVSSAVDGLNKLGGYQAGSITDHQLSVFAYDVFRSVNVLSGIAEKYKVDALGHAADWAESVGKVLGLLGGATDNLTKLGDYQSGSITDMVLSRFAHDVFKSVTVLQGIADKFEIEGLVHAVSWSESAGKIIGVIGGAVDNLTKLGDYKAGQITQMTLSRFAYDVYQSIKVLSGIAEMFGQDGMEQAAAFAESAGKVIGVIGTAVGSFDKLRDYEDVATSRMEILAADIDDAVWLMSDMARTADTEGAAAAGAFASSVGSVFTLFKTGVEAFDSLRDYQAVPQDRMSAVASDFEAAIVLMTTVANRANLEGVQRAAEYSLASQDVFGYFKAGATAIDALRDYESVPADRMRAVLSDFEGAIWLMTQVADRANQDGIAKAQAYSLASTDIFAAFKAGSEAIDSLRDYQGLPPGRMEAFSSDFVRVLTAMGALATQGSAALAQAKLWKQQMEDMRDAINAGIAAIKSIGDIPAVPALPGAPTAPTQQSADRYTPWSLNAATMPNLLTLPTYTASSSYRPELPPLSLPTYQSGIASSRAGGASTVANDNRVIFEAGAIVTQPGQDSRQIASAVVDELARRDRLARTR